MAKYCSKCGAQINDNEKFCSKCGTKIEVAVSPDENYSQPIADGFNNTTSNFIQENSSKKDKRKMSKGKKVKVILITIAVIIVAIAIALSVFFLTSPAYKVYKNMNSENYSEAIIDYNNGVEDNFIQELLMGITMKNYDQKVVDRFSEGKLDYESAITALETLDEMNFDGIDNRINEVIIIKDAETAFEKGNQYYENGDYENAIKEYLKISETNDNYDAAQTKLNEIYPKYISEITETVNEHIKDKKYENAISLLNTSLELLPDSVDASSLTTLKNSTLSEYKTSVVYSATELLNSSKYIEALEVIEKAIEIDDNEEFRNTKTTIETKYIESVKSDVQMMLDKKDYTKALATVNNALVILPQNKELTNLATKIEKETPICITTLERIEFGRYTGNEGDSCLNILGEEHDRGYGNVGVEGEVFKNGFEGWIARWNGTAEKSWVFATYDIDSKYKTFSGSTGLIQSYNTKNFNTTLYIYGDNKLLYSQELTAGKNKFDFEINVKNVDSLKIMLKDNVAVEGGTSIALHNLYLTPTDN